MGFFKKLFGKQEPAWKSRQPKANPLPKTSIETQEEEPDISRIEVSNLGSNVLKDQEAIDKHNQDKKTWLAKNDKIKDEDLVNSSLDIIFPRLKRGHIGTPREQKMVLPTKDGDKEVTLPPELMMAGVDSGPDFSTCLAIDHDAMFTMIYNKHITLSGKSKEEVLRIACNNYTRVQCEIMKISDTIFEGVYELKTDGNSEASAFLFPHIWNNIIEKLKLQTLYMIMPAQNTVLFWESISEETRSTMISKVTEVVKTYPKGSLVSNFLYQFNDNAFDHRGPIFSLDL